MRILSAAAGVALTRPTDRHCCVYVRLVLERAYGAEAIASAPIELWHLILDGALDPSWVGPWAPVNAASRAGIATVSSTPPSAPLIRAHRWHLCQGWRGVPFGRNVTGHTWLWWAITEEVGVVLDSTAGRGPRLAGITSWRELASPYQGGVAVAVLRSPPR